MTHCTLKDGKYSGMGRSPSERGIAGSSGTAERGSDRPVETPERRTTGPHPASVAFGSTRDGSVDLNVENVSYQSRSSEVSGNFITANSEDSSSESEGTISRDESEESSSAESTASDTGDLEDGSSESESDDSSSDGKSANESRSHKKTINDDNDYEISNLDSEFANGRVHCETTLPFECFQNINEAVNGLNLTATTVEQFYPSVIASIYEDVEKPDIIDLTETAGNEENEENVLLFNEIKEEGTCGEEREPEHPLRQKTVCFDEVKKYELKEEIRSLPDFESVEDSLNLFSQTHTESILDRVNQVSGMKQRIALEATVFNDRAADRANIVSQDSNNRSSGRQQISSNSSDSNGIDKGRNQVNRLGSKHVPCASDDPNTDPGETRSSLSLNQAKLPSDQYVKSAPTDASNRDNGQNDGSCDLNSSRTAEHSRAHSDSGCSSDEDEADKRKIDETHTRTRNSIALRQSSDSEAMFFRMKGGDGEDNTCVAMFPRMEADCSLVDNGDGEDCYDTTSEYRGQQRAQDHELDVDYTHFVVQHSLFGGRKKQGHLQNKNEPNVLSRLGGSVREVRRAGCREVLKASVNSPLSRRKKCQVYYDIDRTNEEHFDTMRRRKRRQSCEPKRRERNLLKSSEQLSLSYKEDEKEECFGCNKKFLIILVHLKYSASCREKYDFEAMLESHKKSVERIRAERRKKSSVSKREAVTLKCEGDPRLKKCIGCGKVFMTPLQGFILNHLHKSPLCQQVYGGKEGVRAMTKENCREQRIVHNRQKYIKKRDEILVARRKYYHKHKEAIRRRRKEYKEKNQRKIHGRNVDRFETSKARKEKDEMRRKAVNYEQQDEVNTAEKNKEEQNQGTGVPFQDSAHQRGMSDTENESSLFATAHSPNEHENLGHSLPKKSGMCSLVNDTLAKEPSSLQYSSVLDVPVDPTPVTAETRGKVFSRGLVYSEAPCSGCGKELKQSLYSHLSRSKRCQPHYDVKRVREQHLGMTKQRKRLLNRLYKRKNGGERGTFDKQYKETAEMHGKKDEDDTIGGEQSKIDATKQTCLGCNKQFRVILSHLARSVLCREHNDVEGIREQKRRQQRNRVSELGRQQRSLANEGKPNVN